MPKPLCLLMVLSILAACHINSDAAKAESDGSNGPGWSDALPYYNRGNRYMNQGRYEDALHDYQQAVEKCDSDPDFFINLGSAYEKCNDYANAQKSFEKAISLNKADWSGWNNLANSYVKQNQLVDAVHAFEHALTLNPPATDKEAINKDITDIKKILTAQGIDLNAASAKKAGTPKKTSPVTAKSPSKPIPKAIAKPAVSPALAPAMTPTLDATTPANSKPPQSKSSDWGY